MQVAICIALLSEARTYSLIGVREKPPAMLVDIYLWNKGGIFIKKIKIMLLIDRGTNI